MIYVIQTTKVLTAKKSLIRRMGKESVLSDNIKILLALIVLQLCFSGFHIVSRVALNIGVSKVVFPVYRNIVALLSLGPSAYFLEK